MEDLKILITGAGGWLGSELTSQLLDKGEKIRVINYVYTDNLKKLKGKYGSQLEIVIGNICDPKVIKENIKGIKSVFHLAAKVHCVPTNKYEEEEFFKINADASEELFKQCIENNIKRVIFFSTVSVYKQTNDKITINTEKNPLTVYGKSKLKAENIANKLYQSDGLPITIIEPVTVYGEGDVGNFKKIENMIDKRLCIRFGDGNNKKTVIYYKDLIKMVVRISEDNSYIGKTVICGTEILTINEINDILIRRKNKRVLKIIIPKIISNILIKICSFSVLKKIKRKIMALTQNNEFEINNELDEYTTFREFELKNEGGK